MIIFSIAMVLAFSACSSQKKAATTENKNSATQDTTTVIVFERGVCYGKCPAYKVEIKANGEATYNGKTFAPYQGLHKAQFSQEEIKKILDKALAVKFFDMNDNYDAGATDLPRVTTSVTYNKHTHTVTARGKIPEGLKELNNMIDEMIQSKEWKKAEE
jgi:hypothetical protein